MTEKTILLSWYGDHGDVHFGHGDATSPVGSTFGDEVTYSAPNNVAVFNPRGIGNGGYVYLSNERGRAYAVGTRSTGLIRILTWNGESGDWE